MQVRELVGVELDGKSGGSRSLEDLGGLLRREGDALTKGIDRVGKTLSRQRGDQGADRLQITSAIIGGFRR